MARRTKAEIMAGVECESSRIVGNNTVEYCRVNGDKVLRLHLTDIITWKSNGDIVLSSGGWRTVTTKARLNEFLPNWAYVWQENSIWFLHNKQFDKILPFEDGITMHADGTMSGHGVHVDRLKALGKDIKAYVKGYMEAMFAGDVPTPSGGDCWDCALVDKDGRSLGDVSRAEGHIISHFAEKYYVPSLLQRAIAEIPVSQVAIQVIGFLWKVHDKELHPFYDGIVRRQLASSLQRYLQRQLGLAR